MNDSTSSTPPPHAPSDNGVTLQRPFIVALLYLLNIFLGFSVFVGLILAYIWRGEEKTAEWERTHYTYLIRTFWIGAVVFGVIFFAWFSMFFGVVAMADQGPNNPPPAGFFLAMFGGMGVFFLLAAWYCVRSILSMVKSGNREPMPRPESWLF